MSPLLIACKHGCEQIVRLLFDVEFHGKVVNVMIPDFAKRTSLMYAIQSHNLSIVKEVLSSPNGSALFNFCDRYQRIPLFLACEGAGIFGHLSPTTRGDGEAILDFLWNRFPPANFTDHLDSARWLFWHYAVKHDLKERFKEKLELQHHQRHILLNPLKNNIHPNSVTLVRLAVWQASVKVSLTSFGIVRKILDICLQGIPPQECEQDLDLVLEDIDPEISFMLVEKGLTTRQKATQFVTALLYKALMFGRANVVRRIVTNDKFEVAVDQSIIQFTNGLKFFRCCSLHFITNNNIIPQVCYRVSLPNEQPFIVCAECAIACWKSVSVVLEFADIQAQVCDCWHQKKILGGECGCIDNRQYPVDAPASFPQSAFPMYIPAEFFPTQKLANASLKLSNQAEKGMNTIQGIFSFREYIMKLFLFSVSSTGHDAIAKQLLELLPPNDPMLEASIDETFDTCLHKAAKKDNPSIIMLLLNFYQKHENYRLPSECTQRNSSGHIPLTIAAINGHMRSCQALYHRDVIAHVDRDGLTALHHAVRRGHVKIVRYFAKRCQKDSIDDSERRDMGIMLSANMNSMYSKPTIQQEPGTIEAHATPLHLAVRYGRAKCVQELVQAGCDPFLIDGTGFSPFQTAMWENYKSRIFTMLQIQSSATNNKARERPRADSGATKSDNPDGLRKKSILDRFEAQVQKQTEFRRRMSWKKNEKLSAPTTVERASEALPPYHSQSSEVTFKLLQVMKEDPVVKRKSITMSFSRLYLVSFWYILMSSLFLIFVLPSTSDRYYSTKWIENDILNVSAISSFSSSDDVYAYLHEKIISETAFLFPSGAYGTKNNQTVPGIMLMGAIRLRQIRGILESKRCVVDPDVVSDVTLAKWHTSQELKTGGWAVDSSTFGEAGVYYASLGYSRLNSGVHGNYPSGGYKYDFDKYNETENKLVLENLKNNSWVDKNTRALFLDINLYNFNIPMFTSTRVTFEFAPSGRFASKTTTLAHMVYTDNNDIWSITSYYYPSINFTIVIFIFFIYLLLVELNDIVRERLEYFKDLGNLFDVFVLVCMFLVLYLELVAYSFVTGLFPIPLSDWNDSKKSYNLIEILNTADNLSLVLATVAMLVWVRVLQYVNYIPVFGPMVRGLMNTLQNKSIIAFTFMLLFLLFGFVLAFRTMASDLYQSREYAATFVLFFAYMLGQTVPSEWSDGLARIGVILMFVCVLSMLVISVNIFISILSDVSL
eukprot:c21668_g1_i6.p1 GENE.c21668_g1_i6~~c21668_g1_i6.p1  ORF type:complete len:1224 (-),score=492.22 c21668_g1_i6:65-3736(-)